MVFKYWLVHVAGEEGRGEIIEVSDLLETVSQWGLSHGGLQDYQLLSS